MDWLPEKTPPALGEIVLVTNGAGARITAYRGRKDGEIVWFETRYAEQLPDGFVTKWHYIPDGWQKK